MKNSGNLSVSKKGWYSNTCYILALKDMYKEMVELKNGGILYGVSLKQDGYMGVYFAQANGKNTARE